MIMPSHNGWLPMWAWRLFPAPAFMALQEWEGIPFVSPLPKNWRHSRPPESACCASGKSQLPNVFIGSTGARRMITSQTGGPMRRNKLFALAGILLVFAGSASAHRLDQYLQATRLSLAADQVGVEIDLTPGVEVAPAVFALINTDHDGRI